MATKDSLSSFLNQKDVQQIPADILIKIENHFLAVERNTQQQQIELTQRDETITKLMDEAKATSDVVETIDIDNAEKLLEKMFPRAAADNRMLKNNATLTEIYSRHHDTLGEVHRLSAECLERNKDLERLTLELEETMAQSDEKDKKFFEMEQTMHDRMDELKNLKEEYNEYRKEATSKFNMISEQTETQQVDIANYKKQIQMLEKAEGQLRTDNQKLKKNLQVVESKYANEILAGSSDLQTPTSHVDELHECHEQIQQLQMAKDEAVEKLKSCQLEWAATNKHLNENRRDLERKVENLEKKNLELLAQNSISSATVASQEVRNYLEEQSEEGIATVTQMDMPNILNIEDVRHLTDNNKCLRSENKDLEGKVNDLTEKVAKIEAVMHNELTRKYEDYTLKLFQEFRNEQNGSVNVAKDLDVPIEISIDLTGENDAIDSEASPPKTKKAKGYKRRRDTQSDSAAKLLRICDQNEKTPNLSTGKIILLESSGASSSESTAVDSMNQAQELSSQSMAGSNGTDSDVTLTHTVVDMNEIDSDDGGDVASLDASDTIESAEVPPSPPTTRSQRPKPRINSVNKRQNRSYNRVGRNVAMSEDHSGISKTGAPRSRGNDRSRRTLQ